MLVINTIGNCIEFDFSNVLQENNPTDIKKACPHKSELRVHLPKNETIGVRLIIANDERFYLPYELVASVNGITPTSNDNLYELIKNAYCT
jgi:hypothetical protein